jgi:hypothetical protein
LDKIYPKYEFVGMENLPDEPIIFVGNHAQIHGPVSSELRFPLTARTWCAGEMLSFTKVSNYAYDDFWSEKPKSVRWLYKIASYLIAPISVALFNNAKVIPVYHDTKIISTFKTTLKKLSEGENIIIFPEYKAPHNNIINDFRERFVDIAKMYHNRFEKELSFVPMYVAPKLRKIYFGTPVTFSPDNPIEDERKRICAHLMNEITECARSLPRHTVVPYKNVPKKNFPKNR